MCNTKCIKCDGCGKQIKIGNNVLKMGGYAGLFCSGSCFASAYADNYKLTEQLADDCYKELKDYIE